jgi:glycosyltransferase involved in cell wall biosynthesis
MPQRLISVIIPCYEQAHFLGEAIESILSQTCLDFEIIVVDDGSHDNTSDVVARYPAIRYLRHDHRGVSAARNAGFKES